MKYSQFQGDPVPAVRAAVRAARVPVDGEGRGHLHDVQRRLHLVGVRHRAGRRLLGLPSTRGLEPSSGMLVTKLMGFVRMYRVSLLMRHFLNSLKYHVI